MSQKQIPTLLTIFLTITFTFTNVHSASHHAAPAPAVDCSSVILNLADCLSYVTSGSTVAKPEGSCCSGLKSVLKTNAECLCEGFKNSAQFGVSLNVTKALALPSACKITAPPVSNCGLSIGAAPALSPTAMPPSSISVAPTTPSGANDLAPAPAPGAGSSSESHALAVSAVSLIIGLVFAFFSLFF